jgi:hypothetical protein
MLLTLAALAVVSAGFLLYRYLRRTENIEAVPRFIPDDPPQNARPLFLPTDDELCRETAARSARALARREYRARSAARSAVDKSLLAWRNAPDRVHTVEMLRVTAERGREGDLSRAAGEIVERFQRAGIDGLEARDLAVLLDSHLRLLPVNERGSGELFWLKEEIARLSA